MSNLYLNLSKVQGALNAPKGQYNSFGKYYYRSCEDILSAAKPLCIENGLILTVTDEVIFIEGRHYVEATATIINIEDGEKYSVKAQAREDENKKGMDLSQLTGATSSYARKYALNGIFCIDDTKDADTNEQQQSQSKSPEPPKKEYSNNSNTTWTKETKFTFGKYKGKTAAEVFKENPSYFEYLSENTSDEGLKLYSIKICEYVKNKEENKIQTMSNSLHNHSVALDMMMMEDGDFVK